MLKADLHLHTADDPVDRIPHSASELIDRAAALGYQVLSITLHERQLDVRPLLPYARERGIVLIPGVERTIEGKHVLLINFRRGADEINTFEDLARLRRRDGGLVIAPHPFYPAPSCLRGALERHAALFDAVEYNAMFTRSLNFNDRAAEWARTHAKPMVGNGDVHRLRQLGSTYSWIDAPADADAVCDAIAAGRVRVEATPLSWPDAFAIAADMITADVFRHVPIARRRSRQSVSETAAAAR